MGRSEYVEIDENGEWPGELKVVNTLLCWIGLVFFIFHFSLFLLWEDDLWQG